jgi:nitrite reductase/ring-hydroxylating ferredoxin subunit
MEQSHTGLDAGTFVRVFALSEIKPGSARVETVGEHEVAIFNVDGAIYAIDDLCPHVGGPLHSGPVDAAEKTVTCPLHSWDFRLADGTNCQGRRSVAAYDVDIRDGDVYVAAQPRAGSAKPGQADSIEF